MSKTDLTPAERLKLVEEALEATKRGDCWCEMTVGNPMVRDHSPACRMVARALEALRGMEVRAFEHSYEDVSFSEDNPWALNAIGPAALLTLRNGGDDD